MAKTRPPKTYTEYEAARLRLITSYAPRTYNCGSCGWPVITGFMCSYCDCANPEKRTGKLKNEFEPKD